MPETIACALCGISAASAQPGSPRLANLRAPCAISRCAQCGFVYLSPRPTIDELYEMYVTDPYYAADNASRAATRGRYYGAKLERLERYRPARGRLLGVGCLEGGYALEVARTRGWDVTAVEFSPILAQYARTALGIDVDVARAWDLSTLTARRFDAIMSQSLEHVPDPVATLRQCRDLLEPGGLLFLEVPNQFYSLIDSLKMVVVRAVGDGAYSWFHRDLTFEFHLFYFTPATIRALLARELFEVVALRTHLRAHPLYLGRGPRRWLQGPIHAIGGLVERGPCIEVIARRRDDDGRDRLDTGGRGRSIC